ncbi:MAG: hypothetical protein KIS61_16715 [Candidatus Eremiobacteraeota bacterium]|nr:hypothetical protein [Candidatus Eremiobacteraeota bacterium]
MIVCLSLWAMTWPGAERVWLFPSRIDADCVRDARPVLEREGIPYRLTPSGEGFEVRPEDRARAQVALALAGLPRHRIETRRDPGVLGDCGPSEELLRSRKQKAEALIGQVVSIFPGVQSARVKIKCAYDAAFSENQKPDLVRVWLRLEAPLSAERLAVMGWLIMLDYGDTRDPFEVEILEAGTDRLLWSDST